LCVKEASTRRDGIKYSMLDLVCDIVNYCVWICDAGKLCVCMR